MTSQRPLYRAPGGTRPDLQTSQGVGVMQGDDMDATNYAGCEDAMVAGPELYLALKLGARVTAQIVAACVFLNTRAPAHGQCVPLYVRW